MPSCRTRPAGSREIVSVQGRVNVLGAPAQDGSYPMCLRLYTDETGGTALYEESHLSVPVSESIFALMLGTGTATPGLTYDDLETALHHPGYTDLYMGVAVGALDAGESACTGVEEMEPRIRAAAASSISSPILSPSLWQASRPTSRSAA